MTGTPKLRQNGSEVLSKVERCEIYRLKGTSEMEGGVSRDGISDSRPPPASTGFLGDMSPQRRNRALAGGDNR